MLTATLFERMRVVVGNVGLLTQPEDIAPYVKDWRGNYHGQSKLVIRPANTAEVADIVKLCAEAHIQIVPQGGNTGLVGGATPDMSGTQIILSLNRMRRIRAVDTTNNTMTVEAGCILQTIQQTALEHDRYFPLSLAAEGSCTIGGNLSTNAGGTAVLRYGNTRDLVLGIEAVTADGHIWNGLRGLRKDNTGYDLKHLFIGAEGTLGIITGAVLKLFPKPRQTCTALVGVPHPEAAVELLKSVQTALGDRLTGFELMSRICMDFVFKHFPATAEPFSSRHPWQVLVELTDTLKHAPLEDALAAALEPAFENGLVQDAVIAATQAQAQDLWALRERIPEAEKLQGKSIKHDISVPISHIAEFISRADAALQVAFPEATVICFGHVGDGNLHYNLSFPGAAPSSQQTQAANNIVYSILDELHGSISAEHGLGQMKCEEITHHKSGVELDLMRKIKRAWDPHNIMNPGKVL